MKILLIIKKEISISFPLQEKEASSLIIMLKVNTIWVGGVIESILDIPHGQTWELAGYLSLEQALTHIHLLDTVLHTCELLLSKVIHLFLLRYLINRIFSLLYLIQFLKLWKGKQTLLLAVSGLHHKQRYLVLFLLIPTIFKREVLRVDQLLWQHFINYNNHSFES